VLLGWQLWSLSCKRKVLPQSLYSCELYVWQLWSLSFTSALGEAGCGPWPQSCSSSAVAGGTPIAEELFASPHTGQRLQCACGSIDKLASPSAPTVCLDPFCHQAGSRNSSWPNLVPSTARLESKTALLTRSSNFAWKLGNVGLAGSSCEGYGGGALGGGFGGVTIRGGGGGSGREFQDGDLEPSPGAEFGLAGCL